MHIAFYTPGWPSSDFPNGIVTYVHAMREELLAQGHRVSIFAGQLKKSDTAEPHVYRIEAESGAGIWARVRARLSRESPSPLFDFGSRIAKKVREVHAHDPIDVIEMEESFGWAASVLRGVNVPLVVKLHGPAFLVDQGQGTAFIQEKIRREGIALEQLPVIVSPSNCYLHDTINRYHLRPVISERVVNPIAVDPRTPLWDVERCSRDTLLFVGRFDEVKGGDLVLRAFQILLRRQPGLKLIFVGPDNGLVQADGSVVYFQQYLESLKDPALSRAVSFRGRVDGAEIGPLRTQASLTVVGSRRENQPFSVLEAMVRACPIVCSDSSGIGEIVQHEVTGLKAAPEDVEDFATQMERLLNDPELARRLGCAAREYALKNHSPPDVVARTLEVYRRAVDLHRSRRAA